MSSSVIIRPVERSDEAEWRRLWSDYLTFYESNVTEAVYASTFDRLFDGQTDSPMGRIATLDGQPVGLVHFFYHAHTWLIAPVCYLQDLYADPAIRGQGIGRKLIEAVYEAARADGAARVYWSTQHFNTTARRLYDRVATETPFIKYQHIL